jgi:competence protein ComEA
VAAGWVPTPELVRQELADLAVGDEPRQPPSDEPRPRSADAVGAQPTPSVAWDDAASAPPPRRIDATVLPAVLLVTGGALVGALVLWLLAWPRGEALPVTTPVVLPATSASTSATDGAVAPSATASPGAVVVDVAGEVRKPGVLELPAGSRVVDALDAAGGALPRADTTPLNLARVLLDGEQVVVPTRGRLPGAAAPGVTAPASPAVIDLNAATIEQLDTLPGIGPVLAQRIVDWRTSNGGFSSADQLREVSGIGDATFADLEPLVRV